VRLEGFSVVGAAFVQLGCLGMPSPLAPGLGGSIGVPHNGVLTGGVELPERGEGYLRYRPKGAYYWGLPRLVESVERAAQTVSRARPGGEPLVVGDLSGRYGGKIRRHSSHRTGRDADLLFFVTTPSGASVPSPGFVRFERDGLAAVGKDFVRFDVERNWLLVKTLVASKRSYAQWLFISRDLEALLVDYARSRGEDPALIWYAETMLLQPGDSAPHDDHFHLRLACTPAEAVAGCEGGGPQWEWLPALPVLPAWSPGDLMAIGLDDPFSLDASLETTASRTSLLGDSRDGV
jgi:penicillin-insensitive murein DD-endopeptidase